MGHSSGSRLHAKKALVTGASSGIGRAIVAAFLREGADVVFTYHSATEAATQMESEQAGGRLKAIRADFADFEAYERLAKEALTWLGSIDILVNNAAVADRTGFLDITRESFARVIDVNLRAPFFLSQQVAKHMCAKSPSGGSIIHISSLSAIRARSSMAHYQASKAGLEALSMSIACELGPHGVRSNVIAPGLTATRANEDQWRGDPRKWQQRSAGIPLGRAGLAEDMTGAAVFLASDESAWISGAVITVDGGMATM